MRTGSAKPSPARRRAGAWLAVALVGGLGMACLGRSPEVEHYMLGTGSPASSRASSPASVARGAVAPAVLVGPVRLPAYLERPQLARLESGGGIELDEFHRWLGGFEQNFLRSLALGLARRLDSVKIVAHPSKAPFPIEHRVRLHVDDLIATPAGTLRVRIRWALIDEARGGDASPPPLLALFERELPIEGDSAVALVAAHDRAVEALVEDVAAALER